MSSSIANEIRGFLCSSTSVLSKVPKGNILFGWPKLVEKFPCIIINQVAGSDMGYLGYKSATKGTRIRKETVTFQVDILSRTSRQDLYSVADAVVPLFMVSGNYRKDSEIDTYDDNLSAFRKIQTFTKSHLIDD
ncbi:MAG: hypothetical protein IMZ52_03590 [Actinobacteria bacterium]|nr:hypothetical protein [Actinomycetota bacterium]MBE3114601.1 hypothetical protein [Actinomycetota bacterium]